MTVELMALGALASSVLSGVGYVVWRLYRSHLPSSGNESPPASRDLHTWSGGCDTRTGAASHDRATVAALPPGAILVDRRADGATLTIRMPVGSAVSIQPGTMEPRRVR